jgi:hypothetical protein
VAFDPTGEYLGVGFSNGVIKLLNCDDFEDVSTFAPTSDRIVNLYFSFSGLFLGCFDTENHVLIFKK